ncbi:MAG: serine/threonine protein kinase [Polyangiaceae bacterium]
MANAPAAPFMPASSRSHLLRGVRLGAYEIGALIGHGATASVFEGTHTGLGKRVALKVLHEHLTADEEMRARFVREGRVAAQLEHPNVVGILDVGVDGDVAYLVMERLDGQDLAALLREKRRLSVTDALDVVLPVAAALIFAHDRGIVHRDLKPANIFLARDRHGDIQPKIVDFGLSKLLTTTVETAPLTAHDTVIGTLQYMAPEQTFGTLHAGARADQYALAAILYESLTGQAPFEDESFYALLEKVRHAPLPPMRSLVSSLPLALDEAVIRALSRAPEQRFDGVRALGRALSPMADPQTAAIWERDFARVGESGVAPVVAVEPAAGPVSPSQTSSVRISTQLPCKPGASPFHIKGIAYRGVLQLAKTVPGGLEAVERELDDERVVGFLRQPFLASSWIDLLPMMPINAAIARVLGKPLEVLAREQGAQQARFDGENVYKRLFDAMTFENLPALMARFERQYYDFGDSFAELVAPGHMLLRRIAVPEFILRWYAPMHAAYAEQILRTKGATFVESTVKPPEQASTRDGFRVIDVDTHLLWT